MLMTTLAVLGASSTATSIENRASHYADFLTNVTFRLTDYDIYLESLDSIRKNEFYNPEAMAMALVPMVKRGVASTNGELHGLAIDAINAMGRFQLTNALPLLTELTLTAHGKIPYVAFDAYGMISGHDISFLEVAISAVEAKVLTESFVLGRMKTLLDLDNRIANGQELPQCFRLQEKVKLKMSRMVINFEEDVFESCMSGERLFSRCLDSYTNSLEHVRTQQRINEVLINNKESILKTSACRTMGGNRNLSDDEWYRRATNGCQTEITRVMALPENERLNMTAILDAKIAAIEAAEARAARRAVWKRRLRIGGYVLLPVFGIFATTIVMRRREKAKIPVPPAQPL